MRASVGFIRSIALAETENPEILSMSENFRASVCVLGAR